MSTLNPFPAVQYSEKNQKNIGNLSVSDLDSAENLWGSGDSSLSFRNLLVGPAEQRSQVWQAWLSSGELELIEDPAFYVLSQEFFNRSGEKSTRWAVYGTTEVMSGNILTHENVFPEGVERARQATEACEGDVAPIFASLDEVPGKSLRTTLIDLCAKKPKLATYHDSSGLEISLWKISSKQKIQAIQSVVGDAKMFLLDGHHRFAAAIANLKAGLGDGKILVCLCSMEPEDILIYPIHRLVYCERWMLPSAMMEDLVQGGCRVEAISGKSPNEVETVLLELEKKSESAAVILHAHEDRLYLLKFPDESTLPSFLRTLPVARLDLDVLQKVKCSIIPNGDLRLAMEQLAMDQVQVAFFLPAVKREQVRRSALEKITLPRKSTRFVPKPPIGLVCRPWTF